MGQLNQASYQDEPRVHCVYIKAVDRGGARLMARYPLGAWSARERLFRAWAIVIVIPLVG